MKETIKMTETEDFFKTEKTEVEYKWTQKSTVDGHPKLHISIPVPKEKLEQMFKLEKLMREFGIVFDTGYGRGCRNWEFDWSLKGTHFVYNEERKEYVEIDRSIKKENI